MDLWIRSQSKQKLAKVNELNVAYYAGFVSIRGCINQESSFWLGSYKTEERALEVLDEINAILQLKLYSTLGTFEEVFKGYTEKQLKNILKQMAVYEMPEE